MAEHENRDAAPSERLSAQRLNAVGWGSFLIWMGISFLANLSWATVLIGVGIIIVAGQLARYFFRLPVERSWLVIGILLLAWVGLNLLQHRFDGPFLPGDFLPFLFIVAGIALIVSVLFRKRHRE